jgi:hypothetical protein
MSRTWGRSVLARPPRASSLLAPTPGIFSQQLSPRLFQRVLSHCQGKTRNSACTIDYHDDWTVSITDEFVARPKVRAGERGVIFCYIDVPGPGF